MLSSLHDFLVKELSTCTRNTISYINWATIFFLVSLILNSITGSILISSSNHEYYKEIIFLMCIISTGIVNIVCIIGIILNYKKANEVHSALMQIYIDNKVEKYIEKLIPNNMQIRYLLPSLLVGIYLIISIFIPLLLVLYN
jgi:hypothetical protein